MKRIGSFDNLFTEGTHSARGYKKHAESEFDYLNSHSDVPVLAARTLLESWYRNYPSAHREDLARRFRSKRQKQHFGAFWELYLHELFLRMGYGMEVHATVGAADTRPDFLLTKNGWPVAVLEARLAGLEADEVTSAKRLEGELYDALDRVKSPNFFLQVYEVRTAPQRPSFRKLTKNVETWLTTLNPDLPLDVFLAEREESMQYEWEESGWYLALRVIPKSPGHRGKTGGRAIGVFPIQSGWSDARGELRRALTDKASKYGEFDLPFIIAINHMGMSCDRTDWIDTLFGSQAVNVWFDADGITHQQPFRKNDGFWLGNGEARRTNVGAVIGGWSVSPWSMGAAPHQLQVYSHFAPAQAFDFEGNLTCWVPSSTTGELEEVPGRSSADILDIPAGWPKSWE